MTSDFDDVTKDAILLKKHIVFIIHFSLFNFQKGWKMIILITFSLINPKNSPVDEKSGRLCLCMNDSQMELLTVGVKPKACIFTQLEGIKYTYFYYYLHALNE